MLLKFTARSFFFLFSFLLFACNDDVSPSEKHIDDIKKGDITDHTNTTVEDSSETLEVDSSKLNLSEDTEVKATPKLKLFLFEKDGLYGYKDEQNAVVLEATYRMANDFVNGMTEVVDDKGWAYINGKGEVLARPFIYDNGPDYFQEGLARFVEDEKIGFLDENGEKQIPADFDFAHPFNSGLSAACMGCKEKPFTTESGEHMQMVGGKWGFINKKGSWVVPCEYEAVRDFEEGVGAYKKDDQWIKINPKGEKI